MKLSIVFTLVSMLALASCGAVLPTEVLLDPVVDASGESLVRAYEAKIEKLEKQKLLLADQAAHVVPPKGRFDDFIEHTMTFLASPWSIYENGGIAPAAHSAQISLCRAFELQPRNWLSNR